MINQETGKSNLTNNIPKEFNLGNRSLNRSNAAVYLINIT